MFTKALILRKDKLTILFKGFFWKYWSQNPGTEHGKSSWIIRGSVSTVRRKAIFSHVEINAGSHREQLDVLRSAQQTERRGDAAALSTDWPIHPTSLFGRKVLIQSF